MEENLLEKIADEFFIFFKSEIANGENPLDLTHTPTNLKKISRLNGHHDPLTVYRTFISKYRKELQELGYIAPLPDMLEQISQSQQNNPQNKMPQQEKKQIIEYSDEES